LSAETLRGAAGAVESAAKASELDKAQELTEQVRRELDRCLEYIPTVTTVRLEVE